jgi:hypothetical protein
MKLLRPFLTVLLSSALLVVIARADAAKTIAKARAAVGSESVLNALQSVHYTGTLETTSTDAAGIEKPVKVAIEIIFQRPYRQRIIATSAEKIEITALNDYEGWQREQDPGDTALWRMTLLSKDQIKRLRANTWENLAFFRGIDRRGGRVDDLGTVQQDGQACTKLAFIHADDIIFYRYFDQASGRLLLTETENGIRIREEGDLMAGGLRFPRKMITSNRVDGAKDRVISITFDKVTVNETFADSLFEIPAMSR